MSECWEFDATPTARVILMAKTDSDVFSLRQEPLQCLMFYAIWTSRVIFMAKTSLDIFSLGRKLVLTYSVLGDRIYEMRCLFEAVGPNALFVVRPHWDNMS